MRVCGYTDGMTTDTDTTTTTATFEVGNTYSARSAGDYDCIWIFEVVKRTAKFVTLVEGGDQMRVKVHVDHNGDEWALPFGRYSMSPSVRADRPAA